MAIKVNNNIILDFILFSTDHDYIEAHNFLNKVLTGVENVKGFVYTVKDNSQTDTITNTIGDVYNTCVQTWFYITDNFGQDNILQLYTHECLLQSLLANEKHLTFIPIWTKEKSNYHCIPYGIMSYSGLYSNDINLNKRLTRLFDSSFHKDRKLQLQTMIPHCSITDQRILLSMTL
jgi:hypothetical protein